MRREQVSSEACAQPTVLCQIRDLAKELLRKARRRGYYNRNGEILGVGFLNHIS